MAVNDMAAAMVRLQCADNQLICVDRYVARVSMKIRTRLDDLDINNDAAILFADIRAEIMERAMTWANQHKNDAEPDENKLIMEPIFGRRTDDIPVWDQLFLRDIPQPILFELLNAAEVLDMKGLSDSICKTVANQLKSKTVDEIRNLFNIQNDLTPEEEAIIQKEYDTLINEN